MGLIAIAINGATEAARRLQRLGVDLFEAEKKAVEYAGLLVEARSRRLTKGEVINVRSGALSASIHKDAPYIEPRGGYAVAVGSRTGASERYAPIQEFGGTIHRVSPRGTAYDIVLRPRRFLGIAYDEVKPRVAGILDNEVKKAVARAASG